MAKRNKIDILNGNIWKQILYIFFPILFGTFFQELYNTVDAIVVGNYIGKVALGAVGGTTGTLINLLVGFITGVASGASVVIAQLYGKRDPENVSKAVRTGMLLAIISGLIIMGLGISLAPSLLTLTKVPAEMFGYAKDYMIVYFCGLIPSMIYNMGAGILRAVGDSKRPLYFLIVSTIVNIILDITFVKYLRLEVKGAALATILSQLVACILTLIVLGRSEDCINFKLKELLLDKNLFKRIVIIGIPTGLQSIMYSITNVIIQAIMNTFGTDIVAGFTAEAKIDAIFWMYTGAMGAAIMTVVGQNFGANNIARVKETVKKGFLLHLLGTSIVIASVLTLGRPILSLFTSDLNVIEIGYSIISYLAPTWLTFICVEVFSSTIKACGDSTRPMIFTMLGICVLRIVWMLFCSKETIFDTLFCYPLSWIVTSVGMIIYYFSGIWLKICQKKRELIVGRNSD